MGFYKRRNFFPRHLLLINPRMHICPCSWALGICKNIGIRTYFGSVTAESVGIFRHFGVLYKSARTCQFFCCTQQLQFLWRIFWAHWKSGNFERLKFIWNPHIPLLHPITQDLSKKTRTVPARSDSTIMQKKSWHENREIVAMWVVVMWALRAWWQKRKSAGSWNHHQTLTEHLCCHIWMRSIW